MILFQAMNPASASLLQRLSPPISAITAYDFPAAKIADEAGVQVLLVGDSLGMVVAGNPDTTSVTLEQMAYHTEMVARATTKAIVVADLPINTYRTDRETLESAQILIKAGADAVKLEGGFGQVTKIEALLGAGIPFMGHLGMLPQRVIQEGGYKKKGKSVEEADHLVNAARALEAAGAFSLVLESIVPDVTEKITQSLNIPTIGIGSGFNCSGQIRVLHDVIGSFPWFVPPFAKVYGNVAGEMKKAIENYVNELL